MEIRDHPVIVIAGPSGSGKDTLIEAALNHFPSSLRLGKITVTRPRRTNEADAYLFVSNEEFIDLMASGRFMEHAEYAGYKYGRQWSDIDQRVCVITQEIWGFERLAEIISPLVTIFIAPPSLDVLKQRLLKRGTETPESLARRLNSAEKELARIPLYDYCIVNDHYQDAKSQLLAIIESLLS